MPDNHVEIGNGSIRKLPGLLSSFRNQRILLIAETKAFALHGKTVAESLTREGFELVFIPFSGKEKNKTLKSAEAIVHRLLDSRVNRRTPIIAMGGGVTTDLVGFTASVFMRGVPLFLIPTTLLAQVDAAIGGKNGVNLPEGKNLIGTFYFPEAVIVDPYFLRTLPPKELRSGFAEIIKMSILEGEKFFSEVETATDRGLSSESPLEPLMKRAIEGKIDIVNRDPKEIQGDRALLNLGHTFAHALEAATSYKRYTHGEAVAVGLTAACRLAEKTAGLSSDVTARVQTVIKKCGLPVNYRHVSPKAILKWMDADKKRVTGLRFILPARLGHVIPKENIEEKKILEVLEELKG